MAEVCKHFKDVYFIDPGIYVGEDLEGTIDGVHPNDIGTLRTVDNLLPKLKKILKKYGIKVAKK
jgi:lysophospholipase L1-like esterase